MSLRPSPAGIDVLRRAIRPCRGSVTSPLLLRSFTTSRPQRFLFGRKKDNDQKAAGNQPSAQSQQATPVGTHHDEHGLPLTAFQQKIAALETAALESRKSDDPEPQIELLEALRDGEENNGLVKYYQAVALTPGDQSSLALLKSDEAFELYTHALASTGRMSELSSAVRQRDQRLKEEGVEGDGSTAQAASSSPTSSTVSAPSVPTSTSTSTSAPAAPAAAAPAASSTYHPASILTGTSQAQQQSTAAVDKDGKATSGNQPANATQPGSPLQPIYVQLAPPTPQSNAWRAIRWILGLAFWAFLILTIFSMIMENTGLLKAGPGPAEFEPEEGKKVKFSDVHGVEEAKGELEEIVEFLKNPEKFSKLGGKLPKGVLLTGPPGTGKTMLARAVAGEAEVPFLFASGSSFDEMFVGVGAKRVRDLFAAARKKAPAIIFIDELDAMGGQRSAKDQQHMKQTLNQLLVELDGFEQSDGVIIIAATNFPESLDKALTRPGRFDRHVVVPLPDVRGRIEILKHHMHDIAHDVDVDPEIIARGTPGMSGADLQNLCNQAAIKASREGASSVQLKHFEWAKDRILMGAERRSHFVTEESKRATAYHEGGHALAAMYTPGAMPLHKVTIMPRGQALGITFQLPEADKDSYSRKEYKAMIDVALGGRAAEELIYGGDDVTSGCSSDLRRATDVASSMIRNYGFSDKVGLVAHPEGEDASLSNNKKDEIEGEIRSFVDQGMGRVTQLLRKHETELHTLAKALVEYETLSQDEVRKVLRGEKLNRMKNEGDALKSQSEREMERDERERERAT